jgi:hypothetical protein
MASSFKSFPEFKSVEAFVEFCLDDERTEFTHEDLTALNYRTRTPVAELRSELEAYGLSLQARAVPRRVRGFKTHDYADRFEGFVGGGSGGDQIFGMIGATRPF